MAGQSTPIGEVSAYNDADSLYITVSIEGTYAKDWFIRKNHLYTGEKSQTEGIRNPAPGKFPYSNDVVSSNNTGVQEYTYAVKITDVLTNWGEFDIALHADVVRVATDAQGNIIFDADGRASVVQSEGAWGEGDRFTLKCSWAMHFSYTIQDCTVSCDPSWARNVTVINQGAENYDVEYSLSNDGIRVGNVKVNRGGNGTITVTYTIDDAFVADFDFNKVGAYYSTASLDVVNKSLFDGDHNTIGNPRILTSRVGSGAGKWEVTFNNTPDTSYLTLVADVKGACN